MTTRLLACICAVYWAYAAVAAIAFERLSLVGICAAGFVICLFCAQLLQPRAPFDQEEVEELHTSKFSSAEPLNTTQQIRGTL